jgi:hypothetical protein
MINATTASASQRELSHLIDSVDRWVIAERFGVHDRVHDKTRFELFQRIAEACTTPDATLCDRFQDIARNIDHMASGGSDTEQEDSPYLVNFPELMRYGAKPENAKGYGSLEPFAHTYRWLEQEVALKCPFVKPSLARETLWMTACPRDRSIGESLHQFMDQAQQLFLSLEPTEGRERIFKALAVLFPTAPSSQTSINRIGGALDDLGSDLASADLQLGFFCPSWERSSLPDPQKLTPPLFVLRHNTSILEETDV